MKANIVNDLQNLLDSNPIESYMFPVKKGNRINIGSYSVAPTKTGYSVKSYKSNAIVAETYSKDAAIAIAKSLAKNKNVKISNILEIDSHLAKHQIDCMFYKNSLKRSKDPLRYDILATRFEVSNSMVEEDKTKLKQFII